MVRASKRKLYFFEFQARRQKALPKLDEKAKELLALERYLGELDNSQIAFAVRQREMKTLDEAVTVTFEIQSYLRPGCETRGECVSGYKGCRDPEHCRHIVHWKRPGQSVRQKVNVSAVTEDAGTQSIAATSSTEAARTRL
ncbi:hypothetical protein EMCRGX_G020535 [Ephydatia muelleri]